MERDWLIRKSGYFYRPDRCGYTQEVSAAGRYTRAEAEAEARVEASITAHHVSEFSGSDATAALRGRIAELEAMAEEMVYAIPGGSVCDPQQVSDALREIAAKHGVQIR